MNAEYLKSAVGEVLAEGLASVATYQPVDTIDYLGKWLLNYVDSHIQEVL